LIFQIYEKQGATLITEYATQSTEKNKAFEELLKGNPELYIKTELDPIAEDLLMISKQFVQVLMHLF
jgi:protease-4